MIRDEAARLLADRSGSEDVRRAVASGAGFDSALWSTIASELGWCGMAIPEQYGGLGLGLTELVLLMEATGQRLAAVPLWSTACVAAPLLLVAANERAKTKLLPAIASGDITATVAWGELGAAHPLETTDIVATPDASGYILDGRVAQVVFLEAADVVLAPALIGDQLALFALERDCGYGVRRLDTLDATRQIGELTLAQLHVPTDARIDIAPLDDQSIASALAAANLGLAAEQVGAARGAMDLTLAYITERVQFGRTIASFQAIKHRCARLEVDLAEARALIHGAAARFSAGDQDNLALEAAGARTLASDLLFRAAEESIQLHGGVGFTWEYDPHLYFKRAQASWPMLGAPDAQLEQIAMALLGAGEAA